MSWAPYYNHGFDLAVSAGDTVYYHVNASSKTSGTATAINQSTGEAATMSVKDKTALCQKSGAYMYYNSQNIISDEDIYMANFGKSSFTAAQMTGSSGVVGVAGTEVDLLGMVQKGPIASCSTPNDSTVFVGNEGLEY